ncbi:MAG: hypothetical protein J7J44_02910, partial [Deltaproteobacteria bacterium]|nr:hypothetical protein [Deltaproteobacteria bacterium]
VKIEITKDNMKMILHANSNFSTVPDRVVAVKRHDDEKFTEFLLRGLKELLTKYECNVWR